MKINKWISATYIVFATISCVIGCLMLQPQGSAFFLRHMATVGVGVGAAILIWCLGLETVLSWSGRVVALIVGLSCLAILLEKTHGCNAILYIGDAPIFTPGYFLLPAYVMTLAYLRRINGDIGLVLLATIACVAIPLFTLHTSVFRIVLAMACVLVPLCMAQRRWTACAIICGVVLCITLAPMLYGDQGLECYRDWWRVDYYRQALRDTPWFGPYAGMLPFKPFGGPWDDPVAHAFFTLGRWVIPIITGISVLLFAAMIVALCQTRFDATRKIIIVGSGVALLFPMFGCWERLFWPWRLGFFSAPFLSAGGSSMVASFVLLGLSIAALNGDRVDGRNSAPMSKAIEQMMDVLLVGVAATGILVILYQNYHSRTARIERMLPKAEDGFSYDRQGAVETPGGSIWVPYRKGGGFGEPRIVTGIHECRHGLAVSRRNVPMEPPLVKAKCRQLDSGDIAIDCIDLFKREFTITMKADGGYNHE